MQPTKVLQHTKGRSRTEAVSPAKNKTNPAPPKSSREPREKAFGGTVNPLELRARKLLERPLEFIYNPSFEDLKNEAEFVGPAPVARKRTERVRAPEGLSSSYLASLYEVPLLTREQEAHYFRKMNYLKFRASQLRERLNPKRASIRRVAQIEEFLRQAEETKDLLIRTNLRLVISVVRNAQRGNSEFFDLVSDGNMSLMRAIEKFDYSRGFKFSTYAVWSLRRNFARSIPSEYQRMERFRTGSDEIFKGSKETRSSQFAEERVNKLQHNALEGILNKLQDRERDVITLRFGFGEGTMPMTLAAVGDQLGVSKERIRQLESRALRKLREIVAEEKLDLLGV